MIVQGGSRSNGGFFARHLLRRDHNARVTLVEMRGLTAQTVPEALREMQAVAIGTRAKNYFYHASLNPDPGERLTREQWEQAADILERQLGLTGQPRFVVEHEKEGRTHRHVIWSRIDTDSMRAISDALTYGKHEAAARAIEQALGHASVPSVLVKDRPTKRPDRRAADWESMRAGQTRIDPKAMQTEITALWHATDSGTAFAAALQARGYVLAKGDRRDFVLVDAAGDDHSLARRISGVTAGGIRLRMAGIDRDALPSVTEARALARQGSTGGDSAAPSAALPAPAPRASIPSDVARAVAQVRAAASQYRVREVNLRYKRSPPRQLMRQPRFPPPHDAAMAAEQVRVVAAVFVATIEQLGHIPQLVDDLVADGRHWWERATHQVGEWVDEAREAMHDLASQLHLR